MKNKYRIIEKNGGFFVQKKCWYGWTGIYTDSSHDTFGHETYKEALDAIESHKQQFDKPSKITYLY